MLAFPAAIRIYVAVRPVDMRKSFNGLWSAVSEQLHEDPKSGALFAFINKERTRLKLLYWCHRSIQSVPLWSIQNVPPLGRRDGGRLVG